MKRTRYVHGWKGFIQCVYGKDNGGDWQYIEPCGLREAKNVFRNVQKEKQKHYRIYKLVEVKPTQAGRE